MTMEPYTQVPPFYAQWGEDHWLADTFNIASAGVYVDIGAGDGVRGSNSLFFENLGWRGLCVDADPRNHPALRKRCCAVETDAVSSTAGMWPFGMYTSRPSWSGLLRHGADYDQILVRCQRLESMLDRWCIEQIDLLSIDVEGSELDVWDSFDSIRHPPAMVIVEYDNAQPNRHQDAIHEYVGRTRYEIVHQTPANLVLEHIDRRWRRRQ